VIHPWRDLSPGKAPPELVTAVIEIPARTRNKYELDKESGLFRLDRVLYSAVQYPGDYGLIPRTLHEDNDPLDVLVYIDEPTFTGCLIDVRPIGVLKMLDLGEPDDKILAVAVNDPLVKDYHDISDLPGHYLREVGHFFGIYKDLEGKRAEIVGWEDAESARRVITDSIERYAHAYLEHGP
jgi:inorganic pyrophosphatase